VGTDRKLPSSGEHRGQKVFLTSVFLVAITWLVFGQTLGHDFVDFDDHVYVYENPSITRGLSVDGVIGAFTHAHAGNWHPLTTISHMLDCQLFGLKAGGHHFTNVLLHSIGVVLLFLVLRQMTGGPSRTGSIWQSAFVASLFAIHPLHVESVAWVSERKDVLSAVFFMLTLGLYVRYVRAPSLGRYLAVAVLFALGLMSKPMLVTLPFVLLLLDYWPLNRIRGQRSEVRNQRSGISREPSARQSGYGDGARSVVRGRIFKLIMEKIPLLALSAASCAATLLVQSYSAGAIDQLPFVWRLNNTAISYVAYIWQMFWPARLAAFYPHPNDQLPLWQVLLAIAFLIAVSLLAIHWRKERPYIFTGWFWYVGMLVPVIGLVQVGEQARADRYTYLPQIGLYVLIVWGITDLMAPIMMRNSGSRPVATGLRPVTRGSRGVRTNGPQGRGYKPFCAAIAAAIIIALSWRAFVQTSYWESSEMLWNHTLAITTDNDTAHNNLGYRFLRRGELDRAISHFETALKIRSGNASAHYNFGGALIENTLATALARKGLLDEAIGHYEKAAKLRPDYGDAYFNLGSLLFRQGRIGEAIAQWQKALATLPNDAGFHTALANAFLTRGLQKDAIAEYEHAARISPQDPLARNNLAWLLATSSDASIRDGNRAIEVAEHAVHLSRGKDPNYLRTLAAACAESGRFAEAIAAAEQALRIAGTEGKSGLANALRDEIALYEIGLPYHEHSRSGGF
jgi:tetratricopeptide (TPR) repeat protein